MVTLCGQLPAIQRGQQQLGFQLRFVLTHTDFSDMLRRRPVCLALPDVSGSHASVFTAIPVISGFSDYYESCDSLPAIAGVFVTSEIIEFQFILAL